MSTGTCRHQKSVSGFLEVTCQAIVHCLMCIPAKDLRSPAGAWCAPDHRVSFLTPPAVFLLDFVFLSGSLFTCVQAGFPIFPFLRCSFSSHFCASSSHLQRVAQFGSYSFIHQLYLRARLSLDLPDTSCGHFLDNTWLARVQADEENSSQDRGLGRAKPVLNTLVLLSGGIFLC